ncbi:MULTISPECIES: DegT/DnrJ/EryC1/StrS family aminotransferase [unclassified Streptomyces]|uniref:DegT/DnrJ/EryC1/StrS family aminotransferase n=1 Tax=unclassified Streptomyces TaxID=2593676 RepID=UPI00094051C8|nr:DegT/DnrJ/EryC1/StrS aminotransferase family protein [Streptomyces sp. CB02058]OKI94020.1 lipopolysaccharide biosynthesis protein [Streptomyces sp. CB02058]
MTDWKVPLYRPSLGDAEAAAVADVVRSGWLSTGPVTRALEQEYAAALGVEDSVAVSNGTAALHLAVLALGLTTGDEVIVPSLNFVSAAATVALSGATPVFADITGAHDLCVDPADVEARITPRTRAVVAMHYGGHAADLPALRALTTRHGLALIEDACHAPATRSEHGMLGAVGDIGCFSFFATKNLAAGEGGMVVARDPELLARIRRLRSHAMTVSAQDRHRGGPSTYDIPEIGLNYRTTEISSAIARVQLGELDRRRAGREAVVARYREELGDLPGIVVPFAGRAPRHAAHHLFPVLLPAGTVREDFQARLTAAGVQSGVHYPPTHLFSYYRERFGLGPGLLPVTEDITARQLSLPLYGDMEQDEVSLVIAATRDAWQTEN